MFAMNPRRSIATIAIVLTIGLTIVACGGGDGGGSTSCGVPKLDPRLKLESVSYEGEARATRS
jgi:hypothetical protein